MMYSWNEHVPVELLLLMERWWVYCIINGMTIMILWVNNM